MISCNVWFKYCTNVKWYRLEQHDDRYIVNADCNLPNGYSTSLSFFTHSEEVAKKLVEVIEAEMKEGPNVTL